MGHSLKRRLKVTTKAPLGASLVVLSSLFYASYGIWTTLMGDFFGGYTASAIRSALVLAMLAPLAFIYRQLGPVNWRQNWPFLAGMVVASTLVWGPLYYAILHAGVGVSLVINYAGIIAGMFIFGRIFSGERFTKDKLLSVTLGIIGLWLVFSPSLATAGWLALIAALVSGFGSAANSVFAKKLPYNTTQATLFLWIGSLLANIPMAFLIGEALPQIGWYIEWLYMLFFAIASVCASWLFIRGIKIIEAGAAGVIGLLEIVFAVLFGVVFFGERPGPVVLAGVVVIIAAAAIPYFKDYNAARGTLEEKK